MKVLALDLATLTGAAWRGAENEIVTRVIDLLDLASVSSSKQSQSHGILFEHLYEAISSLVDEVAPDVISVEDDTGLNKKTSAMLAGYRAIIKLVGRHRGVRVVDALDASQARATAGVGGGGTSPRALLRFRALATAGGKSIRKRPMCR